MKSKYSHLTIPIALLLIVVLLFEGNLNNILKYLFTFLLLLTINYMITKNINFSIMLSFTMSVILYYIDKDNKTTYERFENTEEDEDLEKEKIKGEKGLNEILEKLDNGIALESDDLKEHNDIDDESFHDKKDDNNIKGKKIKDYTPQQAQKETFKLIDTVKQLNHTIQALGPTLKEGKAILSSFESLKI